MRSTTSASGRRTLRDGVPYVVYTRTFKASVEDVWAAVTEPERMARWIGTWRGDPPSGSVQFIMTAEGEDVPAATYWIDACHPPTRLNTHSVDEDGTEWRLELDLDETGGVTTLTFAQAVTDPATVEHVGPGWDFYLDRLSVALEGGDVGELDWTDYYPANSAHYRELFT